MSKQLTISTVTYAILGDKTSKIALESYAMIDKVQVLRFT